MLGEEYISVPDESVDEDQSPIDETDEMLRQNLSDTKTQKEAQKNIEKKETLREGYTGAILSWMKTLVVSDTPSPLKDLPLGLKLAAAFPGVLLFTMMMGCSQREIVSCSKDEKEFLDNVKIWINEHPEEIQAKMDELWPNQTITAEQLIKVLNKAQVECAIGGNPDEAGQYDGNAIVVDVDDEYFNGALDAYQRGEWTQDYSLDELAQLASEDEMGVRMDSLAYYTGVSVYADVLAHEAAHMALKQKHEDGIPEQALGQDAYTRAELDQIYAWGSAANLSVLDEGADVDQFLNNSEEE